MLVAAGMLWPLKAQGVEDIQNFKFRQLNGSLATGYNEKNRSWSGSKESHNEEINRQLYGELALAPQISIYHPRFLIIDGSVVVQLRELESETETISKDSDILVNAREENEFINQYMVNLHFLSSHPYNLTLYGRRSTDDWDSNLAGVEDLETTSESIGGILGWNNKWLPMRLTASKSEEQRTQGGGLVDFEYETRNIKYVAERIGKRLRSNFRYFFEDQVDRRPDDEEIIIIEDSQTEVSLINSLSFGSDRLPGSLTNYLRFEEDVEVVNDLTRKTFSSETTLGLTHRPNLSTYYYHEAERTEDQAGREVRFEGEAGLHHQLYENLDTHFSVSGDIENSLSSETWAGGASLSHNYTRSIPFGKLALSGRGSFRVADQDFDTDVRRVLDESHTFDITNTIRLRVEHIRPESIIVRGLSSTHFVENLDYIVRTLGTLTEIVRLETGEIDEGEIVLIDYEFDNNRDRRTLSINREVEFGLHLFRSLSLSTSFSRSGRSTIRGFDPGGADDFIDWASGASFTLGGLSLEAGHVEQRWDISDRNEDYLRGRITINLPFRTLVSATAAWNHIDYFDEQENNNDPDIEDFSEVITYSGNISLNPFDFLSVMGQASLKDETGRNETKDLVFSGLARLRIRKLAIILKANRLFVKDILGNESTIVRERDSEYIGVEVRRHF
jgi:hypothetical protein